MLQRVFKVTTMCMDTRSQSFPPLVNGLIHDALLHSNPRLNKPLPQMVHILDRHSVHALLHHAPDEVVYGIKVGTVGWPHVRTNELRCVTAEELDCVTSTMCWCAVLLEGEHVSSNAADRWKQLLHQHHISVVLSVDFGKESTKIRLVQPSFDTATETNTDLLKVGRVRRKRLALTSCFLVATGAYTRSFCEFIGGATVNSFSSVKKMIPTSCSVAAVNAEHGLIE